jgi:nucleotide-binding universal stress UspA family protein
MYEKILIPLDRRIDAERARGVASDLARADGSTIRLLHVARSPDAVVSEGRVVAYADQEADRLE